jgi:hypothetical protein
MPVGWEKCPDCNGTGEVTEVEQLQRNLDKQKGEAKCSCLWSEEHEWPDPIVKKADCPLHGTKPTTFPHQESERIQNIINGLMMGHNTKIDAEVGISALLESHATQRVEEFAEKLKEKKETYYIDGDVSVDMAVPVAFINQLLKERE